MQIQFADDTTIFYSHKNINYLIWNLIHNLNLLFDLFKANKLSLNIEKIYGNVSWSSELKFSNNRSRRFHYSLGSGNKILRSSH